MKAVIHVDGASRGNPGPSSCGIVIEVDGFPVREIGVYLGSTTNNVAEYCGLILALYEARDAGASEVVVYSDSKLCVQQIKGEFKVSAEHIKPLHNKVMRLFNHFEKWDITLIPREDNQRADHLANRVLDLHKMINED